MSLELIESVFSISDNVRKRAELLTLDDWSPPNNIGICNISWRNERDILNGTLLGRDGFIWCSCEFFNFKGKDNSYSLCKHLYRSMLFLVEKDPKFLEDVISNYIVKGDEIE